MPLTDDDVNRIADAVWAKVIDTTQDGQPGQPARYYVQRTFLVIRQFLGGYSGKPAPEQTMLARIDQNTKK